MKELVYYLKMYWKWFTGILLKVALNHIFLSSEIIISEKIVPVAASELYCLIRNIRNQICSFMSELF